MRINPEQVGRPGRRSPEDFFNAGELPQTGQDFRECFRQAEDVNIWPGIHSGCDGEIFRRPPIPDSLEDFQGLRLPVVEGRLGGHHHSVHQVAVQFGHLRQGCEIPGKDGLTAQIHAAGGVQHAGGLQGAGGCQAHPGFGTDRLMLVAEDGDAIDELPVIGGGDGTGKGVACFGVGDPFHETARNGAAGGPGTEPSQAGEVFF